MERLARDREALPAFYGFPAEHWRHIRTTNLIESTFAAARRRRDETKGGGSRAACLTMVFKLMETASRKWRLLNGSGRLKDVIRGVKFVDGIEAKDAAWITHRPQHLTIAPLARLDPYPGEFVQAEGETDGGASVRVSIGPEFGTLGDGDIKNAALEAIKGSQCDLLLVCAFAFEASVHEQTAELTKELKFGKVKILPVRMNPDLAMGDELLKKTGAGNLLAVFGEPDVKLTRADGKLTVENRGVDVFDPSNGAIRSGDTDDIACWIIDTD